MNNHCFKLWIYKLNKRAINWLPHCHVDATCTFVPSQKGKFCVCNDGFQGSFVNLSLACKKTHVLIERILLSLDLIFRQWDPVCKQGNRNSGGSSWDNRGYYRFVQQVLYMMPIQLVDVEVESRVYFIPVWSECGNIWHLFHRNLVTDNNGQFPEQDEVRSSILQELKCPRTRTKEKCITYFTYWTYINIKAKFPLFKQKLCLFDAFWATDKWWCAIFHPPPAGGELENMQIAKYKILKNRKCYSSAPRGDHEREQNVQRNIFKVLN